MISSTPSISQANEILNRPLRWPPPADWLRQQGHDVIELRELGPDPGDRALLAWAARETRILVTIDTDFGELINLENLSHAGLVRLPDVPARERQLIIQDLLMRYESELRDAVIMITSYRIMYL